MPEINGYLQQFDDAWSHSFESMSFALDGVTEAEAAWQAPCYRTDETEEGWPLPGSIRWQVCHVAHCKRHYTDIFLRVGDSERPDVVPWTPLPSFVSDRDALTDIHAHQREAIVALGEDRLGVIAGNGMPFREFLSMCIRHDIWHASQIVIARRLYRAAHSA